MERCVEDDHEHRLELCNLEELLHLGLTFGLLGLFLGLGLGLGLLLLLGRDGAHLCGLDVADRDGFRVGKLWELGRS